MKGKPVGRHPKYQWVFGGVERGSGICFFVSVEKRNKETLLPLIEKHICHGSTIYSDCWVAYKGILKMEGKINF